MKRKTAIITGISILVVLVLLICVIPIPMKFQPTMQAIKLDGEGNQVGTVQLQLDGWIARSLWSKSLWSLNILSFEDYPEADVPVSRASKDIQGGYNTTSVVINLITPELLTEGGEGESYGFHVAYTDDLECWCIRVDTGGVPGHYYLGSASGETSAQELMEIFKNRLP